MDRFSLTMLQFPPVLEALTDPGAYPGIPEQIGLIKTRISYVFLLADVVYKVKRPVDLGYLDYTTLENRRFFCEREVQLNRRLCPQIYLGVVPIVRSDGSLQVEGVGEPVEYAVKMRRLPQDRMLDVLVKKEQVPPGSMERVADRLADFHSRAETNNDIARFGSPGVVLFNAVENYEQTASYVGVTLSRVKYDLHAAYTSAFLEENAGLIEERVRQGRIRDCHGDLHSEHICLSDGICIYDCIEFNDRFRYSDVASEVGFLAMDLDHHGRADLSRIFVRAYADASHDRDLGRLLKFYKSYRAFVRGKVNSFRSSDAELSEQERREAARSAIQYFDLADFYTRNRPFLFVMSGLVGCGKSTVANELARRYGAHRICSDLVRKRLAGVSPTTPVRLPYGEGIYSSEFTDQTYGAMLGEALEVLDDGCPVVVDATFMQEGKRRAARDLAARTGADFVLIECRADEELIRGRLSHRMRRGSVSDAGPEVFEAQKARLEPVGDLPDEEHIVLDTTRPLGRLVEEIDRKITHLGR